MTLSESQFDSNSILSTIAQLRCCTQVNIQADWQCWEEASLVLTASDLVNGAKCELNAKGHIAWTRGQKVLWLAQKLVVPQNLQSYALKGLSLRLVLTWWAEAAQVYVNHQLVQEGDLFDCATRVLLSSAVTPGEEIVVALRLVSPSHDDGALVRSLCVYESNNPLPEPSWIADELAVLHQYLTTFAPEKLLTLAAAITQIDWSALPDKQKFERSLMQVRTSLQCFSPELKQRQIYLLGHAHLDLAWLWSVDETWVAAQRTFTSVLNLQQEFPELIFCHSSPALYAWIEEHRPDLFAAIQQQVKAGRWEIVGGLWVEPELNLISGESIVRQLLYGQRYVQEKFGSVSTIAWLPDSFGFCATLPQFLKQAKIEYFVTQKLRWNDTTEFPHDIFWWRSPDGTAILSLMSAPIGEGIDAVKMASSAYNWEQQTNLPQYLWLPGVGDHGGGPTRDMLEVARRWQQSPFFPRLEFCTAQSYLQHLKSQQTKYHIHSSPPASPASPAPPAQEATPIPTWEDELYLEFHRGCYTTHAQQKRRNRRCEGLLYQAELIASLATLSAGVAYPQTELEIAWKKVLFNQFHDILPGSAIPQVYVDANLFWQEVEQVGKQILQQSLQAIAAQIALPTPPHPQAQPILVFNPLNWQRTQVVEIVLSESTTDGWQIRNLAGQKVQSQIHIDESQCTLPYHVKKTGSTIAFLAKDIPAIGYRIFWLCPCKSSIAPLEPTLAEFVLENEYLRVTVDSVTGDLSSVFDKTNEREVLSEPGNQLQAFQDGGQYWDAWNIDPNYAQYPLPPAELLAIHYQRQGALQTCVRVVRKINRSTFWQDYILEINSAVLQIKTTVDWQESHVLVKAAFPLNLVADCATYEIPCGVIQRPTQPQTPAGQAKWEVSGLQWADLGTVEYGVSLLNDGKYGYDAQPHQLRLTLLRSSKWPDPDADLGNHEFTYALYPHSNTWQLAHTVRRGYELNLPLQVMLLSPVSDSQFGQLPVVGRLLDLSAENLILMAFKPSEDDPQQFILRCYECHGTSGQLDLQSDLNLAIAHPVNLLEQAIATSEQQTFKILPWKISTFVVKP